MTKKNLKLLEYLTTFMGMAGNLAPYIQAFNIYYLKSAHAVSLYANIIGAASALCWLSYGIAKKVKPLIIANIFGLIGLLLVVGSVLHYS